MTITFRVITALEIMTKHKSENFQEILKVRQNYLEVFKKASENKNKTNNLINLE